MMMIADPVPINGELVKEIIELANQYGYNINNTLNIVTKFMKRYFEEKQKQLEIDQTTINYITRASTYLKVDRIAEKFNLSRGMVMDIISDFYLGQDDLSSDSEILSFL